MRRRHGDEIFGKSFDSFLGVVTKNGLGMLILVAMASTFTSEQTLSQAKFRRDLGTPLVRQAPPGRKAVYFECRGNRVLPIDLAFVRADIDRIFGKNLFPNAQIMEELNAQNRMNDYHRIEFHPDRDFVKVLFKPKEGKLGFSLAEFKGKEKQSEFDAYLGRLNSQEQVVYFLVRPDSFEVFRQARDLARSKGFLVGWGPLAASKEVDFVFGFGLGGNLHID